jgi:hypothetical protein
LTRPRGVPSERPIPDLPIERPNFSLLFRSSSAGAITPASTAQELAEKGQAGEVKIMAGPATVLHPPGPGRRRTEIGGEDVDVTDKLTLTWVRCRSSLIPSRLVWRCKCRVGLIWYRSWASQRATSPSTNSLFSLTQRYRSGRSRLGSRHRDYGRPHVRSMS